MDTRGFNEKDIMSSLDGIAEAISSGGGGGSSLPEVNSDDNGKVLTVVNGAWDKATASGGTFIVEFTMGDTLVPNKTFSETVAACNNGSAIIFRLMDDSGEFKYDYLAQYYVNDNTGYFEANSVTIQPDSDNGIASIVPELIKWDSNGNVTDITGTINTDPNEFVVTLSGHHGEVKDKLFADIRSAYYAGKTIVADISGVENVLDDMPSNFKLTFSGIADNQITFLGCVYASDNIYRIHALIMDDEWCDVGKGQIG